MLLNLFTAVGQRRPTKCSSNPQLLVVCHTAGARGGAAEVLSANRSFGPLVSEASTVILS